MEFNRPDLSEEKPHILRLELDIDIRLKELWDGMSDDDEFNLDRVGAIMRAAYATGYYDALKETDDQSGSLLKAHGYHMPKQAPQPTDPEIPPAA
ncbi:MAG TPA: hypothetical protein VFW52_00340 [Candidatus Saccharimonadales bacterium]|nr:hypothetical protein [Candidatus Saccharimonadales bacterium]